MNGLSGLRLFMVYDTVDKILYGICVTGYHAQQLLDAELAVQWGFMLGAS